MPPTKESISEQLRSVDKLIRSAKYDQSLAIVDQILAQHPKNIYARAYKERIESLLEEQRGSATASVPAATPAAETETTPVIPAKSVQKLSDAVLEAYKTFLNEIWKDGLVSPLEQDRAAEMRQFFNISMDEHEVLDQNARLTCYLNAIRDEWTRGVREFSHLQEKFQVTPQESQVLEPKVQRLIKSLTSKGVILSLDDDRNFLLLIERLLEKNGYLCLNTTSGEEALNLLESFTPDLVLCDIAFGQRNMNGFMFYERFRAIERFASVPFIFISALNQKELIRTGKRIGVDDYLTKPVENDVLLAAIEGKIRRTREMKKAADY